jgi:glycosyltransferase involved in cell wall biosynthesis
MKKILVLSNMYPTKEHPTFGIFVKNQVESLQAHGTEIDVIVNTNPDKGKVNVLSKYIKWFLSFIKYLLKNKNRISLVHVHYVFPTGILALFAKMLLKVPYVVTSHGGDLDQMAKKHPRIQQLTKKILHEASAVIVVGEGLKTEVLERYEVPEAKVHVLSMGVNTTVFKHIEKLDALEALELPSQSKKILFVGNVIRAKGIFELIQAFEKLQDEYSLYIVGSTKDTDFYNEVKSFIADKNIQHVYFVPPQSQQDLANWMSACDVLVLPSHHEGFGLVALEALACGIPVVASNVGGLPYLLSNNRGVLVEPNSSEAIYEGIQRSCNSTIDHESVKQLVHEQSYETIIHTLENIYKQIELDDVR